MKAALFGALVGLAVFAACALFLFLTARAVAAFGDLAALFAPAAFFAVVGAALAASK